MPNASPQEHFEELAAELFDPLIRYARRRVSPDEVDDVVADVMLTVWRRLEDVPEDPLPWAYGVARHVIANRRRGQRRHLRLVERLEAQAETRCQPPPDLGDLDPELESALMALGESDRDILRLWAWEQLEPREIAQVLGTTSNAATLRLRRARSKLASALGRQNRGPSGHVLIDKAEESA